MGDTNCSRMTVKGILANMGPTNCILEGAMEFLAKLDNTSYFW